MQKEQSKQRIKKLKKLISYHRYLYHVLDQQEISDAALDSLKKELFDLEQRFPELITSDSPSQRVGGKPLEKFEKARHLKPMLSFNDAFSEKDMGDWLERILKLLTKKEKGQIGFYCELKIDGLAIELIYKDNVLETGSTRGSGLVGENVTQNLKTIEAVPLRLRKKRDVVADLKKEKIDSSIIKAVENFDFEKLIIVRGEIFISQNEFRKINKAREKAGEEPYANPRNLAAGSIRQLNPKITAARRLDSFAYDIITDFKDKTHQEKHKILKSFGFKTNPYNEYCRNLKEVFEFHKKTQKLREKLPYEIDGVVVIINSNGIFEKLGTVGKAPRGAIAFKFPGKQATTIIKDIKIQVGRTGALTPVALLKPVRVGGVTISRATLHNDDEIKRLGVRIGDTVIVGRAGDVIPEIVKVLSELRTGKEKKFKMPEKCPACGNKVVKKPGEAIHYCINPKCFAKQREYFCHFISKGSFDIDGLGPKIIDQLIEEGLVSDPADLFGLKEGDLISLERFAEKAAQNLVKAIQKRKEVTLPKFIYALGIKNIGEETARDLAKEFGNLKKFKDADIKKLERIKDIGPVAAKSIYDWFCQKRNMKLLRKLKGAGVRIKYYKPQTKNYKLKRKTFVLTGELKTITRDGAKRKIRELGGEVSESVSQRTDFLIVGKNPGSKYQKARKLGIRIINEREFLKMIKL